jgi:hypothetical protein
MSREPEAGSAAAQQVFKIGSDDCPDSGGLLGKLSKA